MYLWTLYNMKLFNSGFCEDSRKPFYKVTSKLSSQTKISWTERKNKQTKTKQMQTIFACHNFQPLNRTDATSRSELTWSWIFLLSSSFKDFTNREQTFISNRLGEYEISFPWQHLSWPFFCTWVQLMFYFNVWHAT